MASDAAASAKVVPPEQFLQSQPDRGTSDSSLLIGRHRGFPFRHRWQHNFFFALLRSPSQECLLLYVRCRLHTTKTFF